jgi:hypothetical protein
MSPFRRRLQVEELEPRTLLATGPLLFASAAAASVAPAHRHPAPALAGAIHGKITARPVTSGAGAAFALTGSGMVGGLGKVTLSGSVHAAGALLPGGMGGRLVLANGRGALTLRVEGTPPGGVASLPDQFEFSVVRGTGAYRHLTGAGTIDLRLGSAAQFALTIQPGVEPSSPPQTLPPPTITSGVRGVVMEGPIAPVERPGVPNTRPLPGAIVSVQPAGGGPEITRQTADAMGDFQIELAPGAYRLVPLPPDPSQVFPRGMPQDVVVGPNQVLDLTLMMDTGIR